MPVSLSHICELLHSSTLGSLQTPLFILASHITLHYLEQRVLAHSYRTRCLLRVRIVRQTAINLDTISFALNKMLDKLPHPIQALLQLPGCTMAAVSTYLQHLGHEIINDAPVVLFMCVASGVAAAAGTLMLHFIFPDKSSSSGMQEMSYRTKDGDQDQHKHTLRPKSTELREQFQQQQQYQAAEQAKLRDQKLPEVEIKAERTQNHQLAGKHDTQEVTSRKHQEPAVNEASKKEKEQKQSTLFRAKKNEPKRSTTKAGKKKEQKCSSPEAARKAEQERVEQEAKLKKLHAKDAATAKAQEQLRRTVKEKKDRNRLKQEAAKNKRLALKQEQDRLEQESRK